MITNKSLEQNNLTEEAKLRSKLNEVMSKYLFGEILLRLNIHIGAFTWADTLLLANSS